MGKLKIPLIYTILLLKNKIIFTYLTNLMIPLIVVDIAKLTLNLTKDIILNPY